MTKTWTRWILCAMLLCPLLVLVVGWSMLSPMAVYSLFFSAVVCIFISLSILLTPGGVQDVISRTGEAGAPRAMMGGDLPPIPRTLAELQRMDDTEFELLSAAILVALGQGHSFRQHTGKSGDGGVDTILYNQYQQVVAVQSKRYDAGNTVRSPALREFWGSIQYYQAVYGYILTTSTFTADARQVIAESRGRIRAYDGSQLETFLHYRSHEIRLALRDIHAALNDTPSPH